MRFKEYLRLVRSDLYRYGGSASFSAFRQAKREAPGFRYSFWLRTCTFLGTRGLEWVPLRWLSWRMLRRYTFKYGISISPSTRIGSGFYIGHFGGIVVGRHVTIGQNCNISQGVTIGQTNRGERKGWPSIGDNVYIGPGAKIIGRVQIGNNVAIGANCVVITDVPDNAVAAGIPGHVISMNGSQGYVDNTESRPLSKRAARS